MKEKTYCRLLERQLAFAKEKKKKNQFDQNLRLESNTLPMRK